MALGAAQMRSSVLDRKDRDETSTFPVLVVDSQRQVALGIQARPVSTANETGTAEKIWMVAPSPWEASIRSNARRRTARYETKSRGRLITSLPGVAAAIDQIKVSAPSTASMRSLLTVALTPSFKATTPPRFRICGHLSDP